jgi:hypothetical protein
MAVTILPVQNCKGLYFMADHPVWMMVCLVRHVHNPTRLANHFSVDLTQTMMSIFPMTRMSIFHSDDVYN